MYKYMSSYFCPPAAVLMLMQPVQPPRHRRDTGILRTDLHNSQIDSDVDRRRRRRRSSFLLLELIFPELLEEPLARQLVVVVEQPA